VPCPPRRDETSQKGGEKRWPPTHGNVTAPMQQQPAGPAGPFASLRPPSCPPRSNSSHSSSGGMAVAVWVFTLLSMRPCCKLRRLGTSMSVSSRSAEHRSLQGFTPGDTFSQECEEERAGEPAARPCPSLWVGPGEPTVMR
jgi:hypothetical protein